MTQVMVERDDTLDVQGTVGSLTEPCLVEAARRGDLSAYGELVRRYERRVLRVIGRFILDAHLVEDLAQETFVRAYERLQQFDTSRRFGPWLLRIAVNISLDHLRKKKRRRWLFLFSESPAESPPEPATTNPRDQLDLRQEVHLLLQQLPENYRTVLILRDMENYSTAEIGAIMDRKEATIRWWLSEARRKFQQLWERRLEGNPPVFKGTPDPLVDFPSPETLDQGSIEI
ncbi:MAG: hypothetical protein KatS3mg113_0312 [Planctomycetaceae bacterium]|nr:MAG: hypothetical protein KatS3mg113_0312 [Planctomycetaceae bacterium]